MTEEEAAAMLVKLREHYNEPVMPMSKYCKALRTWAECIEENNTNPELARGSRYDDWAQGKKYYKTIGHTMMDISKSALLWRLLYNGEELRTKMCPEHKGHLDTNMWCGGCEPCEHGCEGTGWLKNTTCHFAKST